MQSIHKQENYECGLHCIKIKDINVKTGNTTIIENISLHIHCKELTAVIGRNGAGKTTLVKAILDEIPHGGTIEFKDIRDNELKDIKIGYVPQYVNIEKNSPASVYDLFASYITDYPIFLPVRKKISNRIKEQLSIFDGEHLINKSLGELSGGELQRVLLSIAVTPVPNLLILDEPVSGIDQNGMQLFYDNIERLKEFDLAVILISHDLNYVFHHADHVILLDKTILSEGRPDKVFNSEEFKKAFSTHIGGEIYG